MSIEKGQLYRCGANGAVVEILDAADCDVSCCGEAMELLTEKNTDAGNEKHVPVIEQTDAGAKVSVGSIPHPMEAEHYIEWIEIIAGGKAYREFLSPGAVPEAVFPVSAGDIEYAREYCSVHGLWKS